MYHYNCCVPFRLCQVPMDAKYHNVSAPQIRLHENAKYPFMSADPQVGPRMIDDSWTMYIYHRPEDIGVVNYLSE